MKTSGKLMIRVGVLLMLAAGVVSAADFSSWQKKMPITFAGYNPPGGVTTLTNFPALVVLSTNISGFSYRQFQSLTNQDLRFTAADGTTELNYEIESWNTNGSSYVWVQLPLLADTNTAIRGYWGKSNTTAPAYTTNGATWSSEFLGVWHLSEGGTGTRYNSTSNSYGATPYGFTGVESVTGPIGSADQLNGSKYLDVPYVALYDLGTGAGKQWTVSTWYRAEGGLTSFQPLVGKYGASSAACDYMLYTSTGNNCWQTGTAASPGASIRAAEPPRSQWHHTVGTLVASGTQSGVNSLYLDGLWCGSTNYATKVAAQTTLSLKFGYTSGSYYFNGALDEVRIENVVRSSNWVWACYMNQASNTPFASYGSVALVTPVLTVWADAPTVITTNSAIVQGTMIDAGNAENPQVSVCWDTSDKQTNALTDWQHVAALGTNWGVGQAFSTNLNDLIAGGNYTYRIYATNSTGSAWSENAVSFSVPYLLRVQGNPANYGNPLPLGYGDALVAPGTTVTNAVVSPTNVTATLRRTCTGWNTSQLSDGAPFGSGSGTQAVVLVTNHTALTWSWTNEWYLAATNGVGGTVDIAKTGWYTNGTAVTVTATATGDYHFVQWLGSDVPIGMNTNNPLTLTMDTSRVVSASFSTNNTNFALIIAGDYADFGTPAPNSYGTVSTLADFVTYTSSVPLLVTADAGTRARCMGWTLAHTNGTFLASGTETQAVFQVTMPLRLTWLWTNEYYLGVTAGTNGTATTNMTGWYVDGTSISVSATANGGYSFLQWAGQVPAGMSTVSPLALTMNQPWYLRATFTDNTLTELKEWTGTGVWDSDANWSPLGMPGPEDDVVIKSGSVLLQNTTWMRSLVVSNGATMVCSNWNSIVSVSNDVIIKGTVTLPAAFKTSTTNFIGSNNVFFACRNFAVEAGGAIDADYKGYAGEKSPWNSGSLGYGPGASTGDRQGAGHGGRGAGSVGGGTYGSTNAPTAPGSGGNGAYGTTGGAGGGAVRVEASGAVLVNGTISANAAYTNTPSNTGGGSGGSIFITGATFAGTGGVIRANGGGGNNNGGGGGRIALVCTDPVAQRLLPKPVVSFSVMNGLKGTGAELGTLYLSDFSLLPDSMNNCNGRLKGLPPWDLSFSSLTMTDSTLLLPDDVPSVSITVSNNWVMDGSTLDVDGTAVNRTPMMLTVGGDLTLMNASQLSIYAAATNDSTITTGALVTVAGTVSMATNCVIYPYSHNTNGGSVYFRLGNLFMEAGSSIDADGKGWDGGKYNLYSAYGPGGGGSGVGGGGYGGEGGANTTMGQPYGDPNEPALPGSGGDGKNGSTGFRGGGLIRLDVPGTATVNGTLTANGLGSNSGNRACGSGGGIYITADNIVFAAGTITANGGSTSSTAGGAGGGGRIALLARADGFAGLLSADGGTSAGGYPGGTGTVVRTLAAGFMTLTVQGNPDPRGVSSPYGYGSGGLTEGTAVTLTVPSPADELNGTRYACLGWNLTNASGPVSSGSTPQAVFTMATNLWITWNWTNEYYLATSANTNGTLAADRTGWYTNGTQTTLTPVPASGFAFVQWTGTGVPDGTHYIQPLTVTMDQPRTIRAQFAATTAGTRTWGGTGDWFSATNWVGGAQPGVGDTVAITNGAVTLSDPTRIAGLQVTGKGVFYMQAPGTGLDVTGDVLLNGASSRLDMSNTTLRSTGNLWLTNSASFYVRSGTWSLPENYNDSMSPATNYYGALVAVGGDIWIQTNCAIYAYAHPTNGATPLFRARNVTVDLGGRFNADGKGYSGAGQGPGRPVARGGSAYGGNGGGAGTGGEVGGTAYGSSNYPVQAASSCFAIYGGSSKAGGGAVRVEATGSVTVNGEMTADGVNGSHDLGASAGGSVFVRTTGFAGTGSVSAHGGDTSGTSGAGGGGRIAVYSIRPTFTGSLSTNSVRGGIHSTDPTRSGQLGTLVFVTLSAQSSVIFVR